MYGSLFSQDLYSEMDRLQREMRRRFDDVAPGIRGSGRGYPALNIGSTPQSVDIYAFVPGVDPASIRLDLDRRVLTIAGERGAAVDHRSDQSTVHVNERFDGRFQRVVTLPEDVDPDGVTADYSDGVLHVAARRREAARPRRIAVQ